MENNKNDPEVVIAAVVPDQQLPAEIEAKKHSGEAEQKV
jgi:hypothetical protein